MWQPFQKEQHFITTFPLFLSVWGGRRGAEHWVLGGPMPIDDGSWSDSLELELRQL